jgi:stage II sporulation protein AA (anti-sigma F factor antagonist)
MEILETVLDDSAVVRVTGNVNSANAGELAERLARLVAINCRSLVVDLSHLVHMTSAGIRSLLRAEQAARRGGGRFVLCGLHGLTRELFEIGGFLDMFDVAESRDEAVRRAAALPTHQAENPS